MLDKQMKAAKKPATALSQQHQGLQLQDCTLRCTYSCCDAEHTHHQRKRSKSHLHAD